MKIEKYRHPFIFFGFAIGAPWILWTIAGRISHSALWESQNWLIFGSYFGAFGAACPLIWHFDQNGGN